MTVGHLLFSARLALEAVSRNLVRAALTSLGILFGVASVIAMLAIGRGAKQEILAQMQLLGINNVIVTPVVQALEPTGPATSEKSETKHFSPGLTQRDVHSIVQTIPEVEIASGEVVIAAPLFRNGYKRAGKLVGVDRDYFTLVNLPFAAGKGFSPLQMTNGTPVTVIGQEIRARFFAGEDPIGKQLKAGDLWLTVVGVVGQQRASQQVSQKLGIRDPSMDVYVPMNTMLLRIRNRAIPRTSGQNDPFSLLAKRMTDDVAETAEEHHERVNYHQLDRAIVRVRSVDYVPAVADVVRRQLTRRHNGVADFEVVAPELLLKQEQRTRTIFNIVLGSIASISLVVGGIGIMNIMLASVLERIREIGVRRAVGARRLDILSQFLAEAVLISLTGGIIGILVGVGMSFGIERFADVQTSVSPVSVALACGVSITVGLVFGIVPAWHAAEQDPVASLRHE